MSVSTPRSVWWRRDVAGQTRGASSGRGRRPRLSSTTAQPVAVAGHIEDLTRAFPLLADLQPIAWTDEGLLLRPPADADALLAACPLPHRPVRAPGGVADPPSGCVGRIYWRSPGHAPAPAGFTEVVQAPGHAFGWGDHPTTRMCLRRLPSLPDGPALDVGCGSGILGLAWAALRKGPVLATDPDPEAVRQARASAALSGQTRVEVRAGRIGRMERSEVAGRVLLANLPLDGHRELLALLDTPPRAALISGLLRGEATEVVAAYRLLGLRVTAVARQGRWECWSLV